MFFSLVMLLMLWIGGLFADRTIEDPAMRPFAPVASGTRSNGFAAMVAGALILTGGPALATLTDPVAEPLPTDIAARAIPGGWSALPIDGEAPDRWIPRFGSADKAEMLRLTDGQHVVDVFVAAYSHQRDGAEALHWSNRFDDDTIWKRAGLKTITLDTGETGLPTTARRDDLTYFVQHDNGTDFSTRVVASWVLSGDTFTASAKRAKIAQLRARLTGGTAKAAVVALSAQGEDGIAAIEALLADAPVLDGLLD